MSIDINMVTLVGNVGQDPKFVGKNKDVLSFSMATSADVKEKEPIVTWHNIYMFGSGAKAAHEYIKKGKRVGIFGSLSSYVSEKDGKKVRINSVTATKFFPIESYRNKKQKLTGHDNDATDKHRKEQQLEHAKKLYSTQPDFIDDEIPF